MSWQMCIFCGVHILSSEVMPRFNDMHLEIIQEMVTCSNLEEKSAIRNVLKDRTSIFSVAISPKPKNFQELF